MKVLLGQPQRGETGMEREARKGPEESHKGDKSCKETAGEGVRGGGSRSKGLFL